MDTGESGVKLLFCSEFFYPSVGGVQEVMRHLATRMVHAGHEVTVATSTLPNRASDSYQGVAIRSFSIAGNRVNGMSGEVENYQRFLLESDFDLVFIYAAQQWTFDAAWEVLPEINARKIIVPCGYSGLTDLAYREYFHVLPQVLRNFDAIVYHAKNYRDYEFGKSFALDDRAVLIPNGADNIEFSVNADTCFRGRFGINEDALLLLTVGSLNGAKGHLEVAQAFEVLALNGRQAVLLLNGNRMPEHRDEESGLNLLQRLSGSISSKGWLGLAKHFVKSACSALGFKLGYFGRLERCVNRVNHLPDRRVVVCDLPRAELVQAYFAADLFVFASYIEYSPLVLFEACAAGLPFLTVPAGNAEEIVAWTGGGELCKAARNTAGMIRVDPYVLAREIERLLANPARLAAFGEAGRAAWRQRFNWEALSQEYLGLFQRVCAGSSK
jgi:glycosyltransferase involved in cell wall biosynthesis